MKRRAATLMLGAAACAGLLASATAAEADCSGPEFTLAVTRGAPGSTVAVSGRYFFATCSDVFNGVQPSPNAPATDVGIVFVQDGRRTLLRSFPAQSDDGSFAVTVAIPSTAHSGGAQFVATGGFDPVAQNFTVVTGVPELASTGSGASRLAILGFGALAGALILLGISRRRAPTP